MTQPMPRTEDLPTESEIRERLGTCSVEELLAYANAIKIDLEADNLRKALVHEIIEEILERNKPVPIKRTDAEQIALSVYIRNLDNLMYDTYDRILEMMRDLEGDYDRCDDDPVPRHPGGYRETADRIELLRARIEQAIEKPRPRYMLVYQVGIANVFKVETFNMSPFGRNAIRVKQGEFDHCASYAQGLAEAGAMVLTAACYEAGDITNSKWTEDLVSASLVVVRNTKWDGKS